MVSRLIDRPMRPLFEPSFGHELQIVPTCVSADGEHTQDILAVLAASAATCISDIPFHGPVAACRVGFKDGKYIINPTFKEIEEGDMEIVVAGTKDGFTMVEGGANEVSEDVMLGALAEAEKFIKEMCILQEELVAKCAEELNWKRTTTYTMLKRLIEKGFAQNENKIVTSLISKEEVQKRESKDFVEKNFEGSLYSFIAAFTSENNLSDDEIKKIQKLIKDSKKK